jgi:hypothetical protein
MHLASRRAGQPYRAICAANGQPKRLLIDSEHLLQNITSASHLRRCGCLTMKGYIIYANQTWDWIGPAKPTNIGHRLAANVILPEDSDGPPRQVFS